MKFRLFALITLLCWSSATRVRTGSCGHLARHCERTRAGAHCREDHSSRRQQVRRPVIPDRSGCPAKDDGRDLGGWTRREVEGGCGERHLRGHPHSGRECHQRDADAERLPIGSTLSGQRRRPPGPFPKRRHRPNPWIRRRIRDRRGVGKPMATDRRHRRSRRHGDGPTTTCSTRSPLPTMSRTQVSGPRPGSPRTGSRS